MRCLSSLFNTASPHFFGLKSRFLVYGNPNKKNKTHGEQYFKDSEPAQVTKAERHEEYKKWEAKKKGLDQKASHLEKKAHTSVEQFNSIRRSKDEALGPLSLVMENDSVHAPKSLQAIARRKETGLNRRQRKALEEVESLLMELQEVTLNLLKLRSQTVLLGVEQKEVDDLHEFSQEFIKQTEKRENRNNLTEKTAYKNIKAGFDLASKNWLTRDSEKFKHFWTNSSGYSSAKQAESEKWFLAIAATKTNDFENDFLISDLKEFTENPDENQKKFPYLYQQWLEMKGIEDQRLSQSRRAIEQKEKLLAEQGIPPLKDLIENPAYDKVFKFQDNDSFFQTVPNLPEKGHPEEEAQWQTRRDYVDRAMGILNKAIRKAEFYEAHEITAFKAGKAFLEEHREMAVLQLHRIHFLKNHEGAIEQFTKSNLSTAQNRQLRIELAMRKFAAAKTMVEAPFNQAQWGHLHPMVEGLLTAGIYRDGVLQEEDESGQVEKDYSWMITQVTKSPVLNANQRQANLSSEAKEALIYAQMGNHVKQKQKQKKPLDEKKVNEFIPLLEEAIKNPKSTKAKDLKSKIEQGYFDDLIDRKTFEDMNDFQQNVEVSYKSFDLTDSRKEGLSALGIELQGFHSAYRLALQNDLDLKVNHWNHLLFSGQTEDFHKMYAFFESTLPESMTGGKQKFLSGLKVLNRRYQENALKNLTDEEAVTIELFRRLGEHIQHAEEVDAHSDRQDAEIEARLSGELVVDKMGRAIEGVIDGLRNPHDHVTFASSAILVGAGGYLLYRMISDRGENTSPWVKVARWGAGITAANVVSERMTGRGLSSLTGLNTIAKKMEGTQESVLLEKGKPQMEAQNITSEQHANALYELNKLPFHEVMKWYETSDENGMPAEGQKESLLKGVDWGRIYKDNPLSLNKKDAGLEARRILKASAGQFFAYISQKNLGRQGNIKHGADLLKERWVTLVKNPEAKAVRTTVVSHQMAKHYHSRPDQLTWKKVMEMEVDLFDVEQTIGKNGITPALDRLELTGRGFAEWGRNKLGQIQGHVENAMPTLSYGKDKVVTFLGEVGEASGKQLTFAKEEIVFYWEGNQYRIRQFGRKHLEIVLETGEGVLGGAAQLYEGGLDWSLETLRGLNKIINQEDIGRLKGEEFSAKDIAPSLEVVGSYNKEENPPLVHFGRYQSAFYKAFAESEKYFETPSPELNGLHAKAEYCDEKVGYFISQVTLNELDGLMPNPTANEINSKFQVESRKRARDKFLIENKDLTGEEIDRYLYPVHVLRGLEPQKMVTFWRMPLPGSWELQEKKEGRWAGSLDPKRHLNGPPFSLDPTQDVYIQLANLYGVQMDGPVGTALDFGINIGSRPFTFAMQNIESAGKLGADLMDFMKEDSDTAKLIRQLTQSSPEFKANTAEFTGNLDHSPYYEKTPHRQAIYELCKAHAKEKGHHLNLRVLTYDKFELPEEGIPRIDEAQYKKPYPGTHYLEKPSGYKNMWEYYTSLNKFYKDHHAEGSNKKFETMIEKALKEERAKLQP